MPSLVWVLVLLLLAACEPGGEGDSSAFLACSHFRNVARDAADGILTDAELREKLQEVHDDARYSEEPGVADASRDMLAASTAGDVVALEDAVGRKGAACTAAGY